MSKHDEMIRVGDTVRIERDWEMEIRGPDHRSRVGEVGRVAALLTDDVGATVQDPGLFVNNGIGLVWQEECCLVKAGCPEAN